MKQTISFLILLVTVQICWSQKTEQHLFEFAGIKLEKVITEIEQKFDVKYSFIDSIVANKTINLSKKKYNLIVLNKAIELQTSLTIVQIDKRYFSIYNQVQESIKEEQLKEILVVGFLSKGINKVDQKIIISPQKVSLPGVTDSDILLSLQQLPGVKSPNETASGLHIRGGTPDQNLILWDGIRMYHPGHLFGMISGFNPYVVQTVNYYNKATNPKFGERISSVIDVKSTNEITDKIKINAGLNALNADAYLQIPIVKNKLGLQLSGRKSYTEWIQSPTFNSLADKVFQNTNFKSFNDSNTFRFQDYSAKLNYKLSDASDFSFTSIFIDNFLDFKSKTVDSEIVNQKMSILNQGYSFCWNQKYSPKFSHNVVLYYSSYIFDYEKNKQLSANNFEQFSKLNRITDSGLEMNFNYQNNSKLHFEFGYQLLGNDISHSFTNKNQDIEIELDQKNLYNATHVGFVTAKYVLDKWSFNVGSRYNYFSNLKSNSFEPRVFVQQNITNKLIWQVSYEKKSQIVSQVRESVANDLSLENYVWILSDNADYPIQKANQYSTGIIYKTKSWLVDVDAYYKTSTGITSLTFGFLNLLDSNIYVGNGFTKGLDVLVQKSAPTWRTWLTYTYQDSQNKYEGINSNQYFPINSDITHALTLSFYKKWKHYDLTLGWFWHTGRPYSELNVSNEISSFNTKQLPSYHRLDISGSYQFHYQKNWNGKVGFSIFNAYNQRTLLSKEYEKQFTSIGDIINSNYTIQNYYSLGFTPNLFLRVSF